MASLVHGRFAAQVEITMSTSERHPLGGPGDLLQNPNIHEVQLIRMRTAVGGPTQPRCRLSPAALPLGSVGLVEHDPHVFSRTLHDQRKRAVIDRAALSVLKSASSCSLDRCTMSVVWRDYGNDVQGRRNA